MPHHLKQTAHSLFFCRPVPSHAHTSLPCPVSVLWEKLGAPARSGAQMEPREPGVLVGSLPAPPHPRSASAPVHAASPGQPTAASRPCIPKEARFQATLTFDSFSSSQWLKVYLGGIPLPRFGSQSFKRLGISGGSACEFGFLPQTKEGRAGQ